MRVKRIIWLGGLVVLVWFTLACRTIDTLALLRSTVTPSAPRAVRTPNRAATRAALANETDESASPTIMVAVTEPPAEPTQPPAQPQNTESNPPPPARAPTKRAAAPKPTARPPNTAVPPTPTSQYTYKIQESRCGPNVRTYIEGYVYDGSAPKNDVLVRISQGPDGQPDPNDDFRTGSDPRKGYFFQNIDVNAPHQGLWYLWVIDPATMQRISEIAIVKTDAQRVEDTENSAGSCQSATVIFSTGGPRAPARTSVPTRTGTPSTGGGNPTPTPTQDTLNDS